MKWGYCDRDVNSSNFQNIRQENTDLYITSVNYIN